MLNAQERDRMYQRAVTQLDVQFDCAIRDVQFNIAIGRKDEGAKEMARDLFRLGASRLPVHGVRACATDQEAA